MSLFSNESLLQLFSIPTIGPVRMRKLISALGHPDEVLKAPIQKLIAIDGIDLKTAKKIKAGPNPDFVEMQLAGLYRHNATLISYWDDAYPKRLKRIFDPPAFLFIKGRVELLNSPGIGIVGTRVPSSYGQRITQQFTSELCQEGFTIISGFARGIDSIAHHTAIQQGAPTIAVFGTGLDYIYPAENKKMVDTFLNNGLFITEYPFGTKPDAGNFPKRNRIISGLSLGILVTEAGAKSGALLTAIYAADQNREVFSIPGPITSGKSGGCNSLIKQGAKLVQSIQDILVELEGQLQVQFKAKPDPVLEGNEQIIFKVLQNEALHIDQIALQSGLSTSEALTALLTLELKSLVRQMAGKMFVRL